MNLKLKKFWVLMGVLALIVVSVLVIRYLVVFRTNNTINEKEVLVYIPSGAEYKDVLDTLKSSKAIKSIERFDKVAKHFSYPDAVKPGCYAIKPGMNNVQLVRMLRFGHQKPVRVIFTSLRTFNDLAGRISRQIEADSVSLLRCFTSDSVAYNRGFTPENFMAMFIPNTYEFYWNTSALGFVKRMFKEYNRFWNDKRKQKAERIGLTPIEVSILASIVEEETNVKSEMPTVAGVYLNRLRKRIPLQADPTIKFAIGDFSIRRVLNRHLEVDSPYNTYKNRGLPPGPIRIPSITAIDAVLNAKKHSYLYFCASPDFSGRHVFSKTLSEHNRNANAYRRALNKERIYR